VADKEDWTGIKEGREDLRSRAPTAHNRDRENPLATAAGSPGPGQAHKPVLWSWASRGARRRATRWLRCKTRSEGRAVSGTTVHTSWLWASTALLAVGADTLRVQGRAVACEAVASDARRAEGAVGRAA
jgi:hypothetical protein